MVQFGLDMNQKNIKELSTNFDLFQKYYNFFANELILGVSK